MTVRDLQPRYTFLFDGNNGRYSPDLQVRAKVIPGFRETYVCFKLERLPEVFDVDVGYTWVPEFAVLAVREIEL